jgi:hypothetical protein
MSLVRLNDGGGDAAGRDPGVAPSTQPLMGMRTRMANDAARLVRTPATRPLGSFSILRTLSTKRSEGQRRNEEIRS